MRAVELSALYTLTKERRFVSVKDHTKQGTKHMKQRTATVFAATDGNVVNIYTEPPTFEKGVTWGRDKYVTRMLPQGDYKTAITKSQFRRATGETIHIGEVKKVRLVLGATSRTKGAKLTLISNSWDGVSIGNVKGKEITNFCSSGFNEATGLDVAEETERTTYPIAVQIV